MDKATKMVKCKNGFQRFCLVKGISYAQIAKLLGISIWTVYAYSRGTRLPSRKTMKQFEKIFKVDADEVFNYEAKKD